MNDRIDEDLKRGLDKIAGDDYTPDEKRALSEFATQESDREENHTVVTATGPIVWFEIDSPPEGDFYRLLIRAFDEAVPKWARYARVGPSGVTFHRDKHEPKEEVSETDDLARLEARRDEAMRIRHESRASLAHAEDEVERLGSMISRAKTARRKEDEITLDRAKVNALEDSVEELQLRLHHARASLLSIRRIAEDIDLRRDAERSVERVHHIAIDGITRSDPS